MATHIRLFGHQAYITERPAQPEQQPEQINAWNIDTLTETSLTVSRPTFRQRTYTIRRWLDSVTIEADWQMKV